MLMEMDSSTTICFQDATTLETHSSLPLLARLAAREMPVTATLLELVSITSSPPKVSNPLASLLMVTSSGVHTKQTESSGMLAMLMLAMESMLVDITAMPLPTSSPMVQDVSEVPLSSKT
jgi:hypothetical protein